MRNYLSKNPCCAISLGKSFQNYSPETLSKLEFYGLENAHINEKIQTILFFAHARDIYTMKYNIQTIISALVTHSFTYIVSNQNYYLMMRLSEEIPESLPSYHGPQTTVMKRTR